jgi:hypothetical protein
MVDVCSTAAANRISQYHQNHLSGTYTAFEVLRWRGFRRLPATVMMVYALPASPAERQQQRWLADRSAKIWALNRFRNQGI